MNKKIIRVLSLSLLLLTVSLTLAQETAFTYHGQLTFKGAPANGNYDFQFSLFDTEVAGQLIKGPIPMNAVTVVNGLLTVRLDFGENVFNGQARWLQISVRQVGDGAFSPLMPRQEVTSSPYAIRAQSAAFANEVTAGAAVKTVNGLKDNVTLAAGPNVTITPSGNTLTIGSAGSGGNGIWSVNANDTYYATGSVAIGTNSPAPGVRLQVNGNTQITTGGSGGYVQIGTPSGETGLSVIGRNRFDLRFDGTTLKLAANPGVGPPSPHNGITVNTNGNVGVGMESPLAASPWKLDVNGPLRAAKLQLQDNAAQVISGRGLPKALLQVVITSAASATGAYFENCYNGITADNHNSTAQGDCGFGVSWAGGENPAIVTFPFSIRNCFFFVTRVGTRSFQGARPASVEISSDNTLKVYDTGNVFDLMVF